MKAKRRTTIRDVAQASGFSIYTVSSVLNNKGDISEATSEKVRQVARELNYDLLGNVSAARRLTTRSLGIVLPDAGSMHDGFYNRAVSTFRALATARDYDCKLFSEEDVIRRVDPSHIGGIHTLGCKGLVVFCPRQDFKQYIEPLLKHGIAVALIRRKMTKQPGLFQAVDNDELSMRNLLNYLHDDVGCRRFAMMSNSRPSKAVGGREKAFRKFSSEMLPEDASRFFYEGDLTPPDDKERDSLQEFIDKSNKMGQTPVITCWADYAATRLMNMLYQMGYQLPDDVLVTGYDNDPYSGQTFPSITTMNIPIEEMVTAACRYLFEYREEGELPEAKTVRFKHELVVRESAKMVKK